jgi:putative DNA methylase
VHSWKSYTAKQANTQLGRSGEFWARDDFDRYVRDEAHRAAVIAYIDNNPVKSGLVDRPELWPYGSAVRRRTT